MKQFMFLYKGYTTPTPEIGKAWMEWFEAAGPALVDGGNPMTSGAEVTKDAVTAIEQGEESFTGYSIVQAEDRDAALELAATNPMITSVVVYELAKM